MSYPTIGAWQWWIVSFHLRLPNFRLHPIYRLPMLPFLLLGGLYEHRRVMCRGGDRCRIALSSYGNIRWTSGRGCFSNDCSIDGHDASRKVHYGSHELNKSAPSSVPSFAAVSSLLVKSASRGGRVSSYKPALMNGSWAEPSPADVPKSYQESRYIKAIIQNAVIFEKINNIYIYTLLF